MKLVQLKLTSDSKEGYYKKPIFNPPDKKRKSNPFKKIIKNDSEEDNDDESHDDKKPIFNPPDKKRKSNPSKKIIKNDSEEDNDDEAHDDKKPIFNPPETDEAKDNQLKKTRRNNDPRGIPSTVIFGPKEDKVFLQWMLENGNTWADLYRAHLEPLSELNQQQIKSRGGRLSKLKSDDVLVSDDKVIKNYRMDYQRNSSIEIITISLHFNPIEKKVTLVEESESEWMDRYGEKRHAKEKRKPAEEFHQVTDSTTIQEQIENGKKGINKLDYNLMDPVAVEILVAYYFKKFPSLNFSEICRKFCVIETNWRDTHSFLSNMYRKTIDSSTDKCLQCDKFTSVGCSGKCMSCNYLNYETYPLHFWKKGGQWLFTLDTDEGVKLQYDNQLNLPEVYEPELECGLEDNYSSSNISTMGELATIIDEVKDVFSGNVDFGTWKPKINNNLLDISGIDNASSLLQDSIRHNRDFLMQFPENSKHTFLHTSNNMLEPVGMRTKHPALINNIEKVLNITVRENWDDVKGLPCVYLMVYKFPDDTEGFQIGETGGFFKRMGQYRNPPKTENRMCIEAKKKSVYTLCIPLSRVPDENDRKCVETSMICKLLHAGYFPFNMSFSIGSKHLDKLYSVFLNGTRYPLSEGLRINLNTFDIKLPKALILNNGNRNEFSVENHNLVIFSNDELVFKTPIFFRFSERCFRYYFPNAPTAVQQLYQVVRLFPSSWMYMVDPNDDVKRRCSGFPKAFATHVCSMEHKTEFEDFIGYSHSTSCLKYVKGFLPLDMSFKTSEENWKRIVLEVIIRNKLANDSFIKRK